MAARDYGVPILLASEIEISETDTSIAHFVEVCSVSYTKQNEKAVMYHTTLGTLSVLSNNVRRCIVTACFKGNHFHWHTDPTEGYLAASSQCTFLRPVTFSVISVTGPVIVIV